MKNIFGATDTGLVRASNQDTFVVERLSENLAFVVLCDGMGGQNGGNIASDIAVRHAVTALRRDLNADSSELSVRSALFSAIAGANALVFDEASKDEKLKGMGTTMILAVFLKDMLYAAYVGDSRVYYVCEDGESQLTRDHTVVQMLVDMGEITSEEAKNHPKKHFITRAVGASAQIEADFIAQSLGEGDLVLVCSDGFYNYLEPGELKGLLKTCMEKKSVQPLIEHAKSGGGSDNITAIVCGV